MIRALDFYQNVLGFQIIEQQTNIAKLSAGGQSPILALEKQEKPIPLKPGDTGLFHIAYLLPSRRDLAVMLRHLLHIGYPIQGASDHLVSEALYLADPDGNDIEVYVDRDHRDWKWKNGEVAMSTLPLDADSLLKELETDGWNGLPENAIIGHIHLQVANLDNIKPFYVDGLGLISCQDMGAKRFSYLQVDTITILV